jgi:hypothetical protein
MGYAAFMRFAAGELALLDSTPEIELETAKPGGPIHRTIIWVVVDGEEVFIRSARGARGRWYQEVVANPLVRIHAAGVALPAMAQAAADPASIARSSDAFARKYRGDPGLPPILVPDVLDTTIRLTPG